MDTSSQVGFDAALLAIKHSQKVTIRRSAWKEIVPSICLLKPIIKKNDPASRLNPPLIFYQLKKPRHDKPADRVIWLPNLQDLLATDWVIEDGGR